MSLVAVEHTFEDARGHATLKSAGAGVMLFKAVGYYSFELSTQASDAMTEVAKTSSDLHIFVDFSQMDSYESKARAHATAWCRDHFKAVSSVHILTKPGLVAMGVATAAMTLSILGMRFLSYTDRAAFLAEFERTKRGSSPGQT